MIRELFVVGPDPVVPDELGPSMWLEGVFLIESDLKSLEVLSVNLLVVILQIPPHSLSRYLEKESL